MSFVFNKDYHDKEQVREWFPAFSAIREDMKAKGKYPYNDDFKGCIPGIAGPNEDTAIYLLQTLCHLEEEQRKVAALRAEGLQTLERLDDRERFSRVVLWRAGHYVGGTGQIHEYVDARIVPKDGKPYAILPKGKRTNGYLVGTAEVLVQA